MPPILTLGTAVIQKTKNRKCQKHLRISRQIISSTADARYVRRDMEAADQVRVPADFGDYALFDFEGLFFCVIPEKKWHGQKNIGGKAVSHTHKQAELPVATYTC